MKQVLVRYKVKAEKAAENQRLVEAVFEELRARAPAGLQYLVLRLDDDSFVHFAVSQEGAVALPSLPAFQLFREALGERTTEKPLSCEAVIVGNYGMLGAAGAGA
jgi:hypothetical protein